MRFYTTLFILLITIITVKSQTKRALIVGIGDYPSESGWSAIHGDNDVPLVPDMLIQKKFDSDNIVCLINEQRYKNDKW